MKIRNANRKQRLKRIIESILEKIIKAVLCGGMLVSVIVLGVILFALLSFAGRLLLMDSKQRKPSAAQEDIVSIINVIDVPSISENNCNMELLLEPDSFVDGIYVSWKQQRDYYCLSKRRENGEDVHILLHYQEGGKSIDERILDLGGESREKMGRGGLWIVGGSSYVDEEGFLYTIGAYFNGDFDHYCLCTFAPSGNLTTYRPFDVSYHINSYRKELGPYQMVVCPNGNIAFSYKYCDWSLLSNKVEDIPRVAMIRNKEFDSEKDLVFRENSGDVLDLQATENGDLLYAERRKHNDGSSYTTIWKINCITGEKHAIVGNLPFYSEIRFVEGIDSDNIVFRSDNALWEVTGNDEVKLIMRFRDIDGLEGVTQVFRMSDGSYGFVAAVNETEGATHEKGVSRTLVRVSAK